MGSASAIQGTSGADGLQGAAGAGSQPPPGAPRSPVPPVPDRPERADGSSGAEEGSVREYLFFFLGLFPVVVSALRIYLMAHGDSAILLTLLRTLNVSTLMFGTFVRFAGPLGMAVTSFLFLRLYGGGPAVARSWLGRGLARRRIALLTVLGVCFGLFVASCYPEQFFETDKPTDLGPLDLARTLAWLVLAYLLTVAGRAVLWRRGRRARGGRWWGAPRSAAAYTLLPVSVFMGWSLLTSNDSRMWLPAQVVTVNGRPPVMANEEVPDNPHFPVLTGKWGNRYSFVGYVLERDDVEETVLSSYGVVVVVAAPDVVGHQVCQYEEETDAPYDEPLANMWIDNPGQWTQTQPCESLLRKTLGL